MRKYYWQLGWQALKRTVPETRLYGHGRLGLGCVIVSAIGSVPRAPASGFSPRQGNLRNDGRNPALANGAFENGDTGKPRQS